MKTQLPRSARRIATLLVAGAGLFVACRNGATPASTANAPVSSLVSGQAALASFPVAPASIRAVAKDRPAIEVPVATNGVFVIEVPEGAEYRLELAAEGHAYPLVFPRGASFDTGFTVRHEPTAFELGAVRFVGDVHEHSFTVRNAAPDGVGAPAPDCVDGVEKTTGAICVDNEQATSDVCGPDVAMHDAVPCAAGANCGEKAPVAAPPRAPPGNAAVPEHNLPTMLGCGTAG
jgi:hypothetical protein